MVDVLQLVGQIKKIETEKVLTIKEEIRNWCDDNRYLIVDNIPYPTGVSKDVLAEVATDVQFAILAPSLKKSEQSVMFMIGYRWDNIYCVYHVVCIPKISKHKFKPIK